MNKRRPLHITPENSHVAYCGLDWTTNRIPMRDDLTLQDIHDTEHWETGFDRCHACYRTATAIIANRHGLAA